MSWIQSDIILNGEFVKLFPLETKHFDELVELAMEQRTWEFIPNKMDTKEKCIIQFKQALIDKENGSQFPFVIYHLKEQKLIGSTRLMNIEAMHKKLEIGWTWLHPNYWASVINLECKLLLMTFCFEELKAFRVQLKTDETNMRSRKAIQKIGGKYEGILRNDMIKEDGNLRNSAYYSIVLNEWEQTKHNVLQLISQKKYAK